jgi:hypothetical protein
MESEARARQELALDVAETLYLGTDAWDTEEGGRVLGTEIAYLLYGILSGMSMEYPENGLLHRTMKPLFKKNHRVWQFVGLHD